MDLEQWAEEFAGNWQRFRDFCWHDQPEHDEEDHSRREYEATCENVQEVVGRVLREAPSWFTPPEDAAGQVFSWLWDNNQQQLEAQDGGGGYPSEESVAEALAELGIYDPQDPPPFPLLPLAAMAACAHLVTLDYPQRWNGVAMADLTAAIVAQGYSAERVAEGIDAAIAAGVIGPPYNGPADNLRARCGREDLWPQEATGAEEAQEGDFPILPDEAYKGHAPLCA